MFVARKAFWRRKREKNEETSNDIFQFAASAVEQKIPKDAILSFTGKSRTGSQFRINANTGMSFATVKTLVSLIVSGKWAFYKILKM